ncbi:MAG: flagellar hook-associated protein FlgL [Cellvibrio sp.]|nr:flagellar hook-associated protein FlgL [Cellvibrio sp.]
MRVSTNQIYSIVNIGMSNAQTSINKTQEQMSTGKRVLSPADDPVAATTILQLNSELSRVQQYTKNIDSGSNSLNLEETALQSVVNLIQRMQELAVQAGNTAVLSRSDYQALASEVESRTQELLNIQNTRNSSGQYIFSGYQGSTQSFVDLGGGNFKYQGDDGQLRVQASSTVSVGVSDSGKRIFVDVPSGNNTITSSANSTNQSQPAAFISAGDVVDQAAFDEFYPESMVIKFNAVSDVVPPSPNYTITEKSTGKIIADRQVYISGQDIVANGVSFQIYGSPYPGVASVPSNLPFNFTASNFSVVGSAVNVSVGGVTETLVLDQNITSVAEMITALGGDLIYPNANPLSLTASAQANKQKLDNLGVSLSANGFSNLRGLPVSVSNGTAATDTLLSFNTQSGGSAAAIRLVNSGASYNFSLPTQSRTLEISVGSNTQTLTLNQNVTNMASLVSALTAGANATALASLGLVVSSSGIISSASNLPIQISSGSVELSSVMGIETQGNGTESAQGQLAVSGDSFFVDSTNKQGILTTLSRFSMAMREVENTSESKAQLTKVLNNVLKNLDNAISSIASVQGDVGARLNTLDASRDLNLDIEVYSKKVLSEIESLDYAEASTRLSMQSLVLSATQQSFVKISQLSLFSYL